MIWDKNKSDESNLRALEEVPLDSQNRPILEWNMELLRNAGRVSFKEASEGMLLAGRSLRISKLPLPSDHTLYECQLVPYEQLL